MSFDRHQFAGMPLSLPHTALHISICAGRPGRAQVIDSAFGVIHLYGAGGAIADRINPKTHCGRVTTSDGGNIPDDRYYYDYASVRWQ